MEEGILSARSAHTRAVTASPHTFFLSLTLPTLSSLGHDFSTAKSQLDTMTRGVDAIEVRGDLIIDADSATHEVEEDKVRTYLTTLRRLTRLPIIFTLRSHRV
jgi:3-dehydroquinate dehydratase